MTKKIPWSWSRIECFEQCPLKFQHQNILKTIKFKPNPATERGTRIHKNLEEAFTLNKPLPDDLQHMVPLVEQLKKIPGAKHIVEDQVAFDENMNRVGYFSKDVWCRVVMDLAILIPGAKVATILDWKTGKVRPYSDQLALSALAGFYLWPEIDTITAAYMFVDHMHKEPRTFTRDEVPHLMRTFADRAELITITAESGVWKPTATRYCRWCDIDPMYCPVKRGG